MEPIKPCNCDKSRYCWYCWAFNGGKPPTPVPPSERIENRVISKQIKDNRRDPTWSCVYRGKETEEKTECGRCGSRRTMLKILTCEIHGKCVMDVPKDRGVKSCIGCSDFKAPSDQSDEVQPEESPIPITSLVDPRRRVKWSYGITTVPSRRDELFPKTLESLRVGGFDQPRIFVDGARYPNDYFTWSGLEVTCRYPTIRTHGNWFLALAELYIREPNQDRYAIFQDDFVTYHNLRTYLDHCTIPDKGYWNLYTFPSNQELCPEGYTGWYLSNQMGRGAVATVFSQEGVRALLSSQHMVDRPMDHHRGHKSVDGGIVTALKKLGWKEYVHNPSLVQHIGDVSSMGNKPHKKAVSFRGETFDAMTLLPTSITS